MTTASRPLATPLWGARFVGDWLPSCYTTWGDVTKIRLNAAHLCLAQKAQVRHRHASQT